ncbi:UDP-N-acetylmuramoyl-L-alanyl-D-glutamate--2,6-diaminopimelate ligase [Pseudomonas oryzihabitans]|uniref:UDP-N-acetylmuramoyl-L-alanyl-D-glutamate--2, 6-diaminopimelate ligase n=1 Tax=Pseudomonas oryzihabitans TaxID=47885 RepID=UPI002895D8B7|nr:UDP-N-acetylmuramoyl-L-alanyl-D-glutamate--2,6-diaminopimelate ligase [Pseudomonas oryzihabitans]MDT3722035.1 UDP-N-acetylmuramoyl-L-alanyl-D-glutamate--2,6-diaminopimelate ligase [Pseudomonas oryzihabitans]
MSRLLPDLLPGATAAVDIVGLALDSREVQPGFLFLAIPGLHSDGRAHIAAAAEQGAAAIAYEAENAPELPALDIPLVAVLGLAGQLSAIAGRFHGEPSRRLALVGVTGTNGKTSVSQLIAQACDLLGQRCGIVGTLGNGFYGALAEGRHTTPDALKLQATLAELAAVGAASVAMEVSSHGLAQGRVAALAFKVAVFTNLSRDHLDYHGTMAAYGEAKAQLFAWPTLGTRVLNLDDAFGRELATCPSPARTLTYSLDNPKADLHCQHLLFDDHGVRARLVTAQGEGELRSQLIGRFNLSNLLAAIGALLGLGHRLDDILAILPQLQGPAGRMQRLGGAGRPLVVVDYAHTPDALDKVLTALRPHVGAAGRLVCVFGCGGDRDRGKRPEMAAVAERLADQVVVTDDNPRTEDPAVIVADIRAGFRQPEQVLFAGRREAAIALAIAEAKPQDVVVLAGKGHEPYQEIAGVRHPFSDLDQAERALTAWECQHA